VAALTLMMAYAMKHAALSALAWSHRTSERIQHLRAAKPGEGATMPEMETLDWYLHSSLPLGEQSWLSNDPYVFSQVADAAKFVLKTIAPQEDPSVVPPPPQALDPLLAAALMKEFGEGAGAEMMSIMASGPASGEVHGPWLLMIRRWFGEALIERIKQRVGEPTARSSSQPHKSP
jgi:hypothetical protein